MFSLAALFAATRLVIAVSMSSEIDNFSLLSLFEISIYDILLL